MVDGAYDKEIKEMGVIVNTRQVIMNISHKLAHDLNVDSFLKSLPSKIRDYDNLEKMEKYYFVNDVKEMSRILHLLYASMNTDWQTRNKSGEEIGECCRTYPDRIGERILGLLSRLPLIDTFYRKIKYEEYIAKYQNLNEVFMGQNVLERQEEEVFREGAFRKTFPEDRNFLNYELKNRYIEKLREEYEGGIREETEEQLNILLAAYDSHKGNEAFYVKMGIQYWNAKKEALSTKAEAFGKILDSIIEKGEE